MAALRYVILCAARTGSSLLETSLLSHPDILSHGEVYHPDAIGPLRGRHTATVADPIGNAALTALRRADPLRFLNDIVFDAQGRQAVGFKFKHDERLLPQFAATARALEADRGIRVIHLSRLDLFGRFVSWWLASKVTGVTEVHDAGARPRPGPVTIPAAACEADFREVQARDAACRAAFAGHESLSLTYEDLTGPRRAEVLDTVQRFLGVRPRPLTSPLQKVIDRPLPEIVENHAALRAHFRGTPHAALFDA
jgi:LPS sulfotransferase NodH